MLITASFERDSDMGYYDRIQLTVLNGNFALSILCTQHGLISAPLLDHCANRALAVWAVIGRVLSQLQSSLIGWRNRRIIQDVAFCMSS